MKQLWTYVCVIGMWSGGVAWAQLPQIDNYSGDLWSRTGLTGDWGGLRNTLAKKGINLDVDLVQSVLGLNTGGSFRNRDSMRYPYGGYAEYHLNLDTGKLGLWPGGFLCMMGESQFGSFLKGSETGALLPPTPPRSTLSPSTRRPRSPASSSPNFWPSSSASIWARSTPSAAMRMPLPTNGRRSL